MRGNKGFSLVELIIVMAIMTVLMGVLAPAYLQYVEKSKKTSDCTMIGSVMDAIEVVSMDPAVTWEAGQTVTVEVTATSASYDFDGMGTAVEDAIALVVPTNEVYLTSSWTTIEFKATRDSDGNMTFDNLSGVTTDEVEKIAPSLAKRFE